MTYSPFNIHIWETWILSEKKVDYGVRGLGWINPKISLEMQGYKRIGLIFQFVMSF